MQDWETIINSISNEAQKYFVGASGCHDWSHVQRVYELAVAIGEKENADLNVIRLAAYLHDIARKEEMESRGDLCHAAKGAEMAREILGKYELPPEIIDNVCHSIACHRFRKGNEPQTIEAKVIYDADKLDSIGAIGIARAFLFAGSAGSNRLYTGREKELAELGKDLTYAHDDSALLEYEFKLKRIKDKILTKTGKEYAIERHDFMVAFFERFMKEIQGIE